MRLQVEKERRDEPDPGTLQLLDCDLFDDDGVLHRYCEIQSNSKGHWPKHLSNISVPPIHHDGQNLWWYRANIAEP